MQKWPNLDKFSPVSVKLFCFAKKYYSIANRWNGGLESLPQSVIMQECTKQYIIVKCTCVVRTYLPTYLVCNQIYFMLKQSWLLEKKLAAICDVYLDVDFPLKLKKFLVIFWYFTAKCLVFLNSQASVTIFGEISPLWQKLKCLWQFYEGFFSIWLKFGKFGKFWIQLGNFWRHYMDYNENYNEKPFGHNVHNINHLSDNRGT